MIYLYAAVVLVLLWVLNIAISHPIRKALGEENELFKKTVQNGNSLFFNLLGLGVIAIAARYIDFLKWIVVAYAGIASVFALVMLIIALVSTLALKDKDPSHWRLLGSNFLALLGDAIILFVALYLLF